MRRHAILLVCGLALVAGAFGCHRTAAGGGSYMAVARQYFDAVREGRVDDARQLATFETDPIVKQTWEKQVGDYAKRLKAGGRKWWGEPIGGQKVSGQGGEWAIIEVQWRFLAGLGWMPLTGGHYSYFARTVDGKWKMVMSKDMVDRKIPFCPPDQP